MIWENQDKPLAIDPEKINVPPYLPDNEITRRDMAVMYSNIYQMDKQFQQLYDELEENGELENTIVIWFSDNGGPLPREKRAIYDSGTRVPFMIRFPDQYRAGEIEERLCMFPDIPATILSLLGIPIPGYMQGVPFLGEFEGEEREYVFGARDRMDELSDKQGAVRSKDYRYVRNYNPSRTNYLHAQYRLQMPMMQEMIRLLGTDSLNRDQMRWFVAPRHQEEFYDLNNDPHELNNQIQNPNFKSEIQHLREVYEGWIERYSPDWFLSEFENREKMWPNGIQPKLSPPILSETKEGLRLSSVDKGVSFAYQVNGKGYSANHWLLYKEGHPIVLNKGDHLTVVAVRAGMENSDIKHYIKK